MGWRLLALTAATFALVSACGSSPDGNKVASLSEPAKPSDQQQANDGRSDEDKVRDFTRCMTEHGVDIPEPSHAPAPVGSTGGGGISIEVHGDGADKEKIDAANEACRPLLPNGGQPPKLDAAQLDEARRLAKCMREHGVNMPDPDPNNPGVILGKEDAEKIDPEVMKKASEACGGPELHVESREGSGPQSGSTGGGK